MGALQYAYDQRNLMVNHETNPDGTGWVLQAEYVYDGGSDRLQQVDYTGATPITTTYTNDSFGFTQVLVADDGTSQVYNLFGLDLISQDSGSQVRTLLVDGLGSVRVEMVGGVVETATTYSPYGEVLEQVGTSGTVYGFTGEQEDEATGLLYLRARYYSVELKTFMSRDPWEGTGWRPATLNWYLFAQNNPIRYVDPTGYYICESPGTACVPFEPSPLTPQYDLTEWLVNEMVAHATGNELEQMRESYVRWEWISLLDEYCLENVSVLFKLDPPVYPPVPEWYDELAGTFFELNKGFGLWDVKRNMRRTIGVGVVLCGDDSCDWFDYSTPGNILYGFTAASVGVPEEFSMAAGGLLEIMEGTVRIGNYATLFEDPQDAAAVHFGYHLYFRYGPKIRSEHFKASFTEEVQKTMQPPPAGFVPPGPALPQKNRYPVGAFNYTR